MKVAIVHNSEEKSKQVTKQLTTLLEQNQIQIDNRQPELVISVGGDGTLLSAFHRFNHLLNEVSFLVYIPDTWVSIQIGVIMN